MIVVQSITICEFRGIRDLTLNFRGKNFAICGPNGTGKSGVVDGVEFALTGNISRLSGSGTGGLSVKGHGPHVDSRSQPENSYISLTVHIPSLKKDVTIVRTVKDSKNPKLTPDDPDIREILARVALHPEFKLSRRELIRYILAEPGKRSQEVQALLRLDEVENLRTLFQKIVNANDRDVKYLKSAKENAEFALQKALNLPSLSKSHILTAANEKRTLLFLPLLPTLEPNTSIKDGMVSVANNTTQPVKIAKVHAKAEIESMKAQLVGMQSSKFLLESIKVSSAISGLLKDEAFLQSASKESLLQVALNTFDNEVCPVCDTPWKPDDFRANLTHKLQHYAAITKQRKDIEQDLLPIVSRIELMRSTASTVARYGMQLQPAIDCGSISEYVADLARWAVIIKSFLPLSGTIDALSTVINIPSAVQITFSQLETAIATLPEPTQQDAARDFLSVGQEKLEGYRQASLKLKEAEQAAMTAQFIFDMYGKITTAALEKIYKNVEESFSKMYRLINHDDENKFEAQLKPSTGKLGFDVDFYGRGFFPPGAYHSEGHQDGMGLCLYLALMNHLAGNTFTFAVLDDVLMSVDSGHRREVSRMLLQEFPNTQFLLTTHDDIWLRHMKSAGLIEAKGFAQFRTWSVDLGPTEWHNKDVWEEIEEYLKKNDVRAAASLLRNYLEHFAKEACHALRASVEFRGDAQFTLGGLLPNAIRKMKKLLKEGKAVAQSWGQQDKFNSLVSREDKFNSTVQATMIDQWQINKAVHYNEWANFDKNDFTPVVRAYKALVDEFSCLKCSSSVYAIPESGEITALICSCGDVHVNMRKTTKSD